MKRYKTLSLIIMMSVAVASMLACGNGGISGTKSTFEHNGVTRDYIFYQPKDLPANAPLVFVLHGYEGNAEYIQSYTGMNEIANTNGFAVVYPQGSLDRDGITHWNANLRISETDDIGFLTSLAKFLQNSYNLNQQKTFSFGVSNGGFMSYSLACRASEVFSAVGNVIGSMSGNDWADCNPTKPVPVLHIHGLKDTVVPINGTLTTRGGWGGAPHIDEVLKFWAKVNDTTTAEQVSISNNTEAIYYKKGTKNNEVWYYKVDNLEHTWPNMKMHGIEPNKVIWNFFSKY